MVKINTQHRYLPFAKLLNARITKVCGRSSNVIQEIAPKILPWLPTKTAIGNVYTWSLGNAIPAGSKLTSKNKEPAYARQIAVGIFMGWVKDTEDEEGIKKTLAYFLKDKCKSTPEEIAEYIRGKNILRKKRIMQKKRRTTRRYRRKVQEEKE